MLPLVPTLTYLQLGSSHSTPTRPPVAALTQTLRQLPVLRTLILVNYIPSDSYPSSDTETPIGCPSINVLILTDAIRPIQNLLNTIHIPNAYINVIFTDIVMRPALNQFIPAIKTAWKVSDLLPVRDLAIGDTELNRHSLFVEFSFYRKSKHSGLRVAFVKLFPGSLQAFVFPVMLKIVKMDNVMSI